MESEILKKEPEVKGQPYMSINAQAEGAFMAVISVIIGIISLNPLFAIFSLAGPVPSLLLVLRRGVKVGFLATLVAGCLFSFFAGFREGMIFVIEFNLLGLVIGLCVRAKWSSSKILIAGTAVYLISFMIIILAMPLFLGQDITTLMEQSQEQAIEMYKTIYKAANLGEEELDKLLETADLMMVNIKKLFFAGMLMGCLFAMIFQYLVAQKILKRLGYTLPPIVPFSKWKVHWFFAWIFIAGLLLLLYGGYMDSLLNTVGFNILAICQVIYLFAGLSIVYFFLLKYKLPRFASIILLLILIPLLHNILLFIGLFDTWFDFREKFGKKKEEAGEEGKAEEKEEPVSEEKEERKKTKILPDQQKKKKGKKKK